MALYLDGLDDILLASSRPPEEELLLCLMEPQLRKCEPLAPDYVTFDRAIDGSPERTSAWLYEAGRRYLRRQLQNHTRDALIHPGKVAILKAPVKKPEEAATGKGKAPCPFFAKGHCKFGVGCKLNHGPAKKPGKGVGKGGKAKPKGGGAAQSVGCFRRVVRFALGRNADSFISLRLPQELVLRL